MFDFRWLKIQDYRGRNESSNSYHNSVLLKHLKWKGSKSIGNWFTLSVCGQYGTLSVHVNALYFYFFRIRVKMGRISYTVFGLCDFIIPNFDFSKLQNRRSLSETILIILNVCQIWIFIIFRQIDKYSTGSLAPYRSSSRNFESKY